MSDLPQYRRCAEGRFRLTNGTLPLLDRVQQIRPILDRFNATCVGRTAAIIHGVDALPAGVQSRSWPVEIAVAADSTRPQGSAFKIYRWTVPAQHRTRIDSIPVTTPTRTALDCAFVLPRLAAVTVMDQLVRGTPISDLRDMVDEFRGKRWRSTVRSIVSVCDPRAQSPAESWVRCLIHDARLPVPDPQSPVQVESGRTYHLDFGYPAYRLGLEYDGRRHHSAAHDQAFDRARRRLIEDAGWQLIIFRSDDVYGEPDIMLTAVLKALKQRGWRPREHNVRRVEKRINYISMCRRVERENWFNMYMA